ncbi:MAG: ATP synthase subunit I [Terriglobales bacterium]
MNDAGNDDDHGDGHGRSTPPESRDGLPGDELSRDDLARHDLVCDETLIHNRIIPRVLRNMIVVSILLLGPVFWFYRWSGSIGFVFGAAISYVNFHSLTRGVEGLTDRIVNRNSREKGGSIILRFVVRYGLVAAVAYAIFKGSSLAFRGFLWGLCVPAGALMIEAVWEGYAAFRRPE